MTDSIAFEDAVYVPANQAELDVMGNLIARATGDPGSVIPRREGEPVPRWSARAVQEALFDAGYSIVKLDPLATALDPYIEDNEHIDHDSGEAGDNCNRCVAEEAYTALGIKFGDDL